jgi:hypothetical protein
MNAPVGTQPDPAVQPSRSYPAFPAGAAGPPGWVATPFMLTSSFTLFLFPHHLKESGIFSYIFSAPTALYIQNPLYSYTLLQLYSPTAIYSTVATSVKTKSEYRRVLVTAQWHLTPR